MKSIIIAAGSGKRIPEFTKKIPKSMIKINNKSILKRQIDIMRKFKIEKIAIIKGYKSNKINFKKVEYFYNLNFKKNEQLDSFFSAHKWFNDDLLVTFSDIIYQDSILKKVLKSKYNISLAIQKNWKRRYKDRYDHPHNQADKVSIKKQNIVKIGKKLSERDTDGEFLGIFKIKKNFCEKIIKEYKSLKNIKDTRKLQLHNFFNYLIKKKMVLSPIYVDGKFMEIDTFNDFKIAKTIFSKN
jgi:choline kinase